MKIAIFLIALLIFNWLVVKDEEGCPYCIHGYYLTDKARQMERWEVLHDAEVAYINNEMLGGKK